MTDDTKDSPACVDGDTGSCSDVPGPYLRRSRHDRTKRSMTMPNDKTVCGQCNMNATANSTVANGAGCPAQAHTSWSRVDWHYNEHSNPRAGNWNCAPQHRRAEIARPRQRYLLARRVDGRSGRGTREVEMCARRAHAPDCEHTPALPLEKHNTSN